MAYIIKSAGGGSRYNSELANAGPDAMAAFQRQRDTLKLALAGSRDCRRLWSDFQAEQPAMARLVSADVARERQEGTEVSRDLDRRLAEAERLVTKSGKPKVSKAEKAMRRYPPQTARKRASAGSRDDPFSPAALLNSSDPNMRELARQALGGHG